MAYQETINKIDSLLESDADLTPEVRALLEESRKRLQEVRSIDQIMVVTKMLTMLFGIS